MAKQVYECNWVPSRVTEAELDDLVLIGALGSKDTIHWRAPGKECPPTPREGEVVVFVDHLARGFKPPGSKFYRDVLADFQLHPQDTGPNSVTNMCHFQVLCEAFFQEEPTVELFRDLFHLNHLSYPFRLSQLFHPYLLFHLNHLSLLFRPVHLNRLSYRLFHLFLAPQM